MTAAHLRAPSVATERHPGCTGKFAYQGRADAIRAADALPMATVRSWGKTVRPWPQRCGHCGGWHLTTPGRQ